jgi:hypothetical protein
MHDACMVRYVDPARKAMVPLRPARQDVVQAFAEDADGIAGLGPRRHRAGVETTHTDETIARWPKSGETRGFAENPQSSAIS